MAQDPKSNSRNLGTAAYPTCCGPGDLFCQTATLETPRTKVRFMAEDKVQHVAATSIRADIIQISGALCESKKCIAMALSSLFFTRGMMSSCPTCRALASARAVFFTTKAMIFAITDPIVNVVFFSDFERVSRNSNLGADSPSCSPESCLQHSHVCSTLQSSEIPFHAMIWTHLWRQTPMRRSTGVCVCG